MWVDCNTLKKEMNDFVEFTTELLETKEHDEQTTAYLEGSIAVGKKFKDKLEKIVFNWADDGK